MIGLGLCLEAGAVVVIQAAVEAVMMVLLLRVMGMILGARRGFGATSEIYR